MEYTERKVRGLQDALPHWQSLSFLVALSMTQWFCYINYKGAGLDKTVALVYILLPSSIMISLIAYTLISGISFNRFHLDELRLVEMAAFGLLGFIMSWAITLLLLGQLGGQEFGYIPITSLWGTVLTQVLFVACAEELLFRYLLPAYLKGAFHRHWWFIPVLISQASFAMFHWGVYGGTVFSLIVAFFFGLIMYGAYHVKVAGTKLGLGFTIGAHAAYNLVLVGVLAGSGHIITTVGGL